MTSADGVSTSEGEVSCLTGDTLPRCMARTAAATECEALAHVALGSLEVHAKA